MTSDGTPYGQERFKEIVRERFLISKHSNTSYNDLAEVTPLERKYILQFIIEDLQKQKDAIDSVKQKQNQNNY